MNLKYYYLIASLLLLIVQAAAVGTYQDTNVTSFAVAAPAGSSITSVYLYDIQPNFNLSMMFDSYGEIYTLSVGSTRSWGYWTFDVGLEYPNGTVSYTTLTSLQPFARDVDIRIQYFYGFELDFVDVDLYVGLLPLVASFTNPVSSESRIGQVMASTGATYTRLPFSNVSGDCTAPFDLKVYFSTEEEFYSQRMEEVGEYLKGNASLFFQWTWDAVLSFLNAIPGVGPFFATTVEFAAVFVGDLFFYIKLFFIDYLETTLLTLEFFILSDAIINMRQRANIMQFINRIVTNHTRVIMFVGNVIIAALGLVPMVIDTVTRIINSLKL